MLTKNDIERFLVEINDEMAKRKISGEMVICGGAVMTAIELYGQYKAGETE